MLETLHNDCQLPTILTCVDAMGRLFRRSMYLHADDQKWFSHPSKKVNPLEKWLFYSTSAESAQEAATLVKDYVARGRQLDEALLRLKAKESE